MRRRNLLAWIWASGALLLPSTAKAEYCPAFGKHHNFVFDRNEPREGEPKGWWWDIYKCKCGAELKELVASPRG